MKRTERQETVSITVYLVVNDWELDCKVKAIVYPEIKGQAFGPPDKCHPDEPPSVEYLEATVVRAYRSLDERYFGAVFPSKPIQFTPEQFEFIAKLSEGSNWELSDLNCDAFEIAYDQSSIETTGG